MNESLLSPDRISELNEKFFERSLKSPDYIYMDIQFFKDFHIGKYVLSPEMSKATHQKFLDQLPAYNTRNIYDFKFLGFQPNTNVSADVLFRASPITTFYTKWLDSYFLVANNHAAMLGKHGDVTVVINTFPFTLSHENKFSIADNIAEKYGVSVLVINKDPAHISPSVWLQYDDIFLFRPNVYLTIPEIQTKYSELKMLQKRLYVPRLTDAFSKNYTEAFRRDEAYMSIMTTFAFLPPSVLSPIVGVK